MDESLSENKKLFIVACFDCLQPVWAIYTATNDEGNSFDMVECGNEECKRFGLASLRWKELPVPEGGENNGGNERN